MSHAYAWTSSIFFVREERNKRGFTNEPDFLLNDIALVNLVKNTSKDK